VNRAAGVMLLSAEGRVLFLRRSRSGDHAGQWCFPGGGIEDGETPQEAAIRELAEECDIAAKPRHLSFWTRRIADDVDFTTFIVRGVEEFDPVLNGEHTQFLWADPKQPPRPLHPGCEIALKRLDMHELGVAQAMRDDELHGPQDYENIVLFAMRITGTGTAFRHKWGEYVQRDPAIYLNNDFLARCNGLPVVMEHPESSVLTTEDFRDRTIGTIMLAYIKGAEVWGIAKIYDATAAQMMKDEQLSTSPAVVWRDPDVNTKMETEDGEVILIEGKPSLLDHLAVCRAGVWDKGGEPTGIDSLNGGSVRQAETRMDAVMTALDSVSDKLLDALLRKWSST
jgi:8-oxo-dGTP pyrophosphatase MutT (NUDIX family)